LPAYIDYFEEDGALYLVMQQIEGESLAALRARGAVLGLVDVWRFLRDASVVLDYLHGRAPPVIHRDIKPGNVIRRPDGSFAFVDFGSVRDKLKPAGGSTVVGTFGYMAPEQFQDLPHRGLAIDVPLALGGHAPPELVHALRVMLDPDPDQRARRIAPLLPEAAASRAERSNRRQRPGARSRRSRRPRAASSHPLATPLFVLLFLTFGLIGARLAVAVALRVIVPALLLALAILFGPGLRRAARGVMQAGARAMAALDRAQRAVHRGRRADVIDTDGYEVADGDRKTQPRSRARVRIDSSDEAKDTGDSGEDSTASHGRNTRRSRRFVDD
jgi:hypothetical protein